MTEISFKTIEELFDPDDWDVGVLSAEQLAQASNAPIKWKFHFNGEDFTNDIHFQGITNTIVLVRKSHTWDYTHYEEAEKILKGSGLKRWFQVFTNYKEAAILAGLGVRAKNSLIYNYKFGFDMHITCFAFEDTITDFPKNRRVNKKLWQRCNGCWDCSINCPAGAIHNTEEPFWLDASKCDNFIAYSDHPRIPSIKKFWHEHIYPEMSKDEVDKIQTHFDAKARFGGYLPFDQNGYVFDGNVTRKNGKVVQVPFCRECTSQPRCSKWDGNYPYDEIVDREITDEQPIRWVYT